jgi:hypothetical protein
MTDTPRIDRAARWITVAASVWFAFAAGWGMFGIPAAGHIGAGSAGNVMAAEQSVKWRTLYPLWDWYGRDRPDIHMAALCHHPFGQYWIPAFLYWIFGHHDFIVHLPAFLMSAAIPPLLYGIAKERWGSAVGAVAAAAYVVVPIAVGFSSYWNLETICIFGTLLFFWGHSRNVTTGKKRYLYASLAGLTVACSGDWVGYLLVAPTLTWCFLRAFVLPPRATPYLPYGRYTRWWALSVGIAVSTLILWLGLFRHAGHLGEWVASGEQRAGGEGMPLGAMLESRKAWIDFSFTPIAIAIGKLAAPVGPLRLAVTREDEETYAPGLLFGAVAQYLGFAEGADVHIFWPHYFAPYLALALAQLVATLARGVKLVVGRYSSTRAPAVAAVAALAMGLAPVVAMADDGAKSLWVWRRTGGRYDDHGTLLRSQVDELYPMREVARRASPAGSTIDAHGSAGWGWEHQWSFEGNANPVGGPAASAPHTTTHPFWIARGSGMSADDQRRFAGQAHVRVYGDTWLVDQREGPAPLDAYSLNEREPNVFEWLFYGGTEPTRSIGPRPDPWLTWEWRTHLGQAADPPSGEPRTADEMRIAHNAAIARGDDAEAVRWRSRIEGLLDRSVRTSFLPGVDLLGVRTPGGVEPRVESWFEVTAPMGDATFEVRSQMVARGAFSSIPPDATDRSMAWPPSIPTRLWRPRWIYKTDAVLNHRIGVERYLGAWRGMGAGPLPRRADGAAETTLVVLP